MAVRREVAVGVLSRLAARVLALPAPATRRVHVERRHLVPMRDGVRLRTDHYAPDLSGAPTVLVRTPYGLDAALGLLADPGGGIRVVRGAGLPRRRAELPRYRRLRGRLRADAPRAGRRPGHRRLATRPAVVLRRAVHVRPQLRRLRPVGDRGRRRAGPQGHRPGRQRLGLPRLDVPGRLVRARHGPHLGRPAALPEAAATPPAPGAGPCARAPAAG